MTSRTIMDSTRGKYGCRGDFSTGDSRPPSDSQPSVIYRRDERSDSVPAMTQTAAGSRRLHMQKGNLDSASADAHGRITKQSVALDGVTATRVTFNSGARWSEDLKTYAGTDSCMLPHVALVLRGTLRVRMDDGSEESFGPQDLMLLPPGHDAWTVGDEPCVFVEFSRGNDLYDEPVQPGRT